MICYSCRLGGTHNTDENYTRAIECHEACEGDCGCQHKTGPGWFVKRGAKVPTMQTQSP
jgi:hypothetical protein